MIRMVVPIRAIRQARCTRLHPCLGHVRNTFRMFGYVWVPPPSRFSTTGRPSQCMPARPPCACTTPIAPTDPRNRPVAIMIAMEYERIRSKRGRHLSLRPGLRNSSSSCRVEMQPLSQDDLPACGIDLPHHIMLEVLTFLKTRAIVRAREVSSAFRDDAPALIEKIAFEKGQKFPSATRMKAFSNVTQVHLAGHNCLVSAAAAGLKGASSLRRLTILRPLGVQQRSPLSKGAINNVCALPLVEFDMRRMEINFHPKLRMPAWRTLESLVILDGLISDASLINLVESIPEGPLPMRHLDLSRNLIGHERAMQPLAAALWSFREMDKLELTADRLSAEGAQFIISELLDGACPKIKTLDLSLNFLDNGVLAYLASGLGREAHGLQNLGKLGIGGRHSIEQGVTCFKTLASALAAGGLPKLDFLHLQGDVGPAQVAPLLRNFKLGACPKLAIVKVERSSPSHPPEDVDATEDAVSSMLELVVSSHILYLREVHVLGMNLSSGLEWAEEEERTPFYRAKNESSFHRLAVAGANVGVMVFV